MLQFLFGKTLTDYSTASSSCLAVSSNSGGLSSPVSHAVSICQLPLPSPVSRWPSCRCWKVAGFLRSNWAVSFGAWDGAGTLFQAILFSKTQSVYRFAYCFFKFFSFQWCVSRNPKDATFAAVITKVELYHRRRQKRWRWCEET